MFFLGEYTHMITTSFLMVALFFGGWHLWGLLPESGLWAASLKLVVFGAKMALFIFFYMFIRWTIPRFRFDQLMGIAWRVLIPLALANLVAVMVVLEVIRVYQLNPAWEWLLLPLSLAVLLGVGVGATKLPAAPHQSRTPLTA
jgi:NADH-quinone oxidoreductase subunit H